MIRVDIPASRFRLDAQREESQQARYDDSLHPVSPDFHTVPFRFSMLACLNRDVSLGRSHGLTRHPTHREEACATRFFPFTRLRWKPRFVKSWRNARRVFFEEDRLRRGVAQEPWGATALQPRRASSKMGVK